MQQTKNIRNELLKRNEIEGVVMAEKNPTFDEMRKVIADKFSAPEENITVLGIKGQFGKNTFVVRSHVYDKKEGKEQILKIEKTRKQKKEEIKKKTDETKAKADAEKKAHEEKAAQAAAAIPTPTEQKAP